MIIFLCIGVSYLISGYDVTITNDSVTNLEQIVALDLISRSSHFTFHLIGIIFYIIFTLLGGLPAITSVEIMLASMSILGSISLYIISKTYFDNQRIALISVIIYAFTSGVFRFSLQVEYLILVPSLALISLALYGKKQYYASGLAWAMGFLTSPFILFFFPAFFLWVEIKQILCRKNYIFLAGFLSLYFVVSIFTFSHSVKGDWSYSLVANYYTRVFLNLNYIKIAAIWMYGYLRSFIIVIPFILIGLHQSFKYHRRFLGISILIVIMHLPAAIPEARYGGYQLTAYPFIALLVAIGIEKLFPKYHHLAFAVLITHLFINTFIVYSEREFQRDLRDTYVALQNNPVIPEGAFLFTYQAAKPIEKIYAPKIRAITLRTEYQDRTAKNLPGYNQPSIESLINDNNALYLLESGMSMPDDYVKLKFNNFVKKQGAKVKGFGKERLMCCVDTSAFVLLFQYPIEVYQIIK